MKRSEKRVVAEKPGSPKNEKRVQIEEKEQEDDSESSEASWSDYYCLFYDSLILMLLWQRKGEEVREGGIVRLYTHCRLCTLSIINRNWKRYFINPYTSLLQTRTVKQVQWQSTIGRKLWLQCLQMDEDTLSKEEKTHPYQDYQKIVCGDTIIDYEYVHTLTSFSVSIHRLVQLKAKTYYQYAL